MNPFGLYSRPVTTAAGGGYFVGLVNSGINLGYLRSDSPDMSGATFTNVTSISSSSFDFNCNLQEVNGVLFILSASAIDPSVVSTDGGVTWQDTNINISPASRVLSEPITWNGTYYYRYHFRSSDGINWAITPNSPNAGIVPYTSYSRASDGYIMMSYNQAPLAGQTYYSTDNSATWTLGGSLSGNVWYGYGATDGTRVWAVNTGDGGAYTDNFYIGRTANGTSPGFHKLYKAGTWLGLRGNLIKRVTGSGTAWTTQATLTSPASEGQTFAYDEAVVRCFERKTTSFDIQESSDDGVTWASLGNITGYTPNAYTSYVHIP